MNIIMILILWTWELTPLWVNIVGTVCCGLGIIARILNGIYEVLK